jgi:glycosyltransferase involved in cell wall biosynthesis
VVAFTRATATMIRSRAPRARIDVIPHGIDLCRFRPQGRAVRLDLPRPVFLSAGEVERHKRLHLTVEALSGLERGSLVVLGGGAEAAALDRRADESLGPGRYLRTRVPRGEMPAWYRAADCFTLPSLSESFGLVYLEAMACGVPCVGTDDEVRREVLGEAGMLCDVTDPGSYRRALQATAERDWQGRPRRQAERFDFRTTAAAYARLFRALSSPETEPGGVG